MTKDLGYIPYGAYWSTPFARWQGSLAHLHALRFAAHTAKRELDHRGISAGDIEVGILGTTIPQRNSFYGAPWVLGMIGAAHAGGPTVSQACATSARCVQLAAFEIAQRQFETVLVMTADRTSNGPHLYYPAPAAPGGTGEAEDWVLDSFNHDPYGNVAMIQTAENVARKYGITTEEQHDLVLQRYEQYSGTSEAFFGRYMARPFEVPDKTYRKTAATLAGDEGVVASTREGLARLRPVLDGGTVTYGGQTHPADGNAAMLVTTKERVAQFTKRPEIAIGIAGFGMARTEKAHMPQAPVPATQRALDQAGWRIGDLASITSHNPFAVNDLVFARETGASLAMMNRHGCSLIWGHPQGPTGLRAMIELIEDLVERGGGRGLFQGCAAGDTAMAVLIEVGDASSGG